MHHFLYLLSNPSNSTLYQAKHNPQGYRNYQQSIPLTLPDHSEHLIDLPSDIFLTSRIGKPIPLLIFYFLKSKY